MLGEFGWAHVHPAQDRKVGAAMPLGELILAVGLLTGSAPPAWEDPALLQAHFPVLRFVLTSLALDWEILDPRETRYILARPEDLASDLKLLRDRYQDLKDAPPLVDCLRFPDRSTINELLVHNRAYRNSTEARQPIELTHRADILSAQREADLLYQIWDTARDARCEYYYITVRRQALKRLRELIGQEAYLKGELPPHVPLWRYQVIE
ncbi:MAG: hypothetical protein C4297_08595 [Gemmataceae bacterium]